MYSFPPQWYRLILAFIASLSTKDVSTLRPPSTVALDRRTTILESNLALGHSTPNVRTGPSSSAPFECSVASPETKQKLK